MCTGDKKLVSVQFFIISTFTLYCDRIFSQPTTDNLPCYVIVYACRYLRDEDDGVSEAIIDFAVQYVGILKVSFYVLSYSTDSHAGFSSASVQLV